MLNKFVQQHEGSEWDEFIQSALFAYRTNIQKSTKFTPFFLLYGRNEETPLTRKTNPEEDDLEWFVDEHVNLITERLHNTHLTAKQNINKAQQSQKDRYDKNIKPVQFKIGEQVLLRESHHENVHGDKFREKWSGPYEIFQVWKHGVYKRSHLLRRKLFRRQSLRRQSLRRQSFRLKFILSKVNFVESSFRRKLFRRLMYRTNDK